MAFSACLLQGDESVLNHSNVFEVLTRLRQACCAGQLVPLERLRAAELVLKQVGTTLTPEQGRDLLDKLKDTLDATDCPAECAICLDALHNQGSVVLKQCGHVFCQECLGRVCSTNSLCPLCRGQFMQTDMVAYTTALEAAGKKTDEQLADNDFGPSPKLKALWTKIEQMKPDEKGVVFSQFTKFLDLIQSHLQAQGVVTVRIDGSKSAKQRVQAMHDFQQDEGPKIMLCSLHAAGTGINLTRANHVFVRPPFLSAFLTVINTNLCCRCWIPGGTKLSKCKQSIEYIALDRLVASSTAAVLLWRTVSSPAWSNSRKPRLPWVREPSKSSRNKIVRRSVATT